MQRAANHLLIAWLIAFLAAGPARAAPAALVPGPDFYAGKGGTKLLVVVAPADARAKSLAGLVEHAAEAAADSSDRFQAVRGIDAFDATAASARAAKETEARGLVTEAQKALDDLDSAKATKQFADAVAAWKQADLTRGIDGLVEAQIGKAAGHATSEENPQSKAELDKALLIAPKAKLSDAHFPPELLKYADGQRAKLAKAKGKLTVRTEPPGARVWIDGVYRGPSPATAEGLGAGPHVVSAGLSGFALATDDLPLGDQLIKLKPAEGAAQFQAAIDRIVQDPEGSGRDQAAKELAQAARADQVLVLVVKKGASAEQLDISAVRLDGIDGHVYASRPGGSMVSADAKGIGELAGTLLGTDEPRGAAGAPAASKSKGKGGGMSGMRIAGIGLLGGAVAAGASWAIFGVSALGRANQYKSTFQVEAVKSNQAARDGRTFALIADISWAVGAAFLVAGVLLVLLGGGGGGGGSSGSKASKQQGGEDDAMREYRRHQEEQKRQDEERQKKAAETPPPAEEKKPEEQKPAEEKKPEETKPPPEEKKKLTPEEEKAEKKRKAEEEKAEKKKKADEEKAEKKRKADEEKKKAEDEKAEKKRQADEAKKKAEDEKAEKKRQADEAKKKAEDEKLEKKRQAEEDKKKSEEDKKRSEEDKKKAAEDDEKKKKDDEQRKADEEARRMDDERKKKDEAERKREEERKKEDRPPEKKKNDLEEDLRDDR